MMINRRISFLRVIAVIFAIIYPFSPAGIQGRNMAKARAHIPIVQRAVGADPRFADITFRDFTNHGGCLLVRGTVPTRADLDELEQIVATTSPPVEVEYAVYPDDEMALSHARALIEETLGADRQFAHVSLVDAKTSGNKLIVSGTVPTIIALGRLREMVASTAPPKPVTFEVNVRDE
jgi:hypothetical protein